MVLCDHAIHTVRTTGSLVASCRDDLRVQEIQHDFVVDAVLNVDVNRDGRRRTSSPYMTTRLSPENSRRYSTDTTRTPSRPFAKRTLSFASASTPAASLTTCRPASST